MEAALAFKTKPDRKRVRASYAWKERAVMARLRLDLARLRFLTQFKKSWSKNSSIGLKIVDNNYPHLISIFRI